MDSVTDFALKFSANGTLINLCLFSKAPYIPKTGERVMLPGEDGRGAGVYRVLNVTSCFGADGTGDPCPAILLSVAIEVKLEDSSPH